MFSQLQTLAWHPVEASVLLSGSMGGLLAARDCRTEAIAAQSVTLSVSEGKRGQSSWNMTRIGSSYQVVARLGRAD